MPALKTIDAVRSRPRVPPVGRMTEAEFIDWCTEDTWAEWIDGEVRVLNAVALDHADMFTFIFTLLHGFIEAHDLGRLLSEPYQIRLPSKRSRRSPDIFFVSAARAHLLEKTQLNGAPDLIVEIVSPEYQSRDRREKVMEYEAGGVAEYWLVDSGSRSFEAYTLNTRGKYEAIVPTIDGAVYSKVLAGLFFRTQWVLQLKLPKVTPLFSQMALTRQKRSSTRKGR